MAVTLMWATSVVSVAMLQDNDAAGYIMIIESIREKAV
jgi:hypothetical protein